MLGMLLLQIVATPIQAGFSDFYCRKKSLIIALSASLVSVCFVTIYDMQILYWTPILIMVNFIKGCLGNTTSLAWAAIGDTQKGNFRISFALSTAMFAVAYIFLFYAKTVFSGNSLNLVIIGIFVILIFVCIKFFDDVRDKHHRIGTRDHLRLSLKQLIKRELILLVKEVIKKGTRRALLAFFFWEVSIYTILVATLDLGAINFWQLPAWMWFGYLVGVWALKQMSHLSDVKLLKYGYWVSFLSLVPYFFIFNNEKYGIYILALCYFCHTLGNALLSPTLFAILSKTRKSHEQGKTYGLVDSVDTIALLIASISVIISKNYNLPTVWIVLYSFITFSVSWIFYDDIRQQGK